MSLIRFVGHVMPFNQGNIYFFIIIMKFFHLITVWLAVFSQVCLAFQPGNDRVICVNDSGFFRTEHSVNGICEDSEKWESQNRLGAVPVFNGISSRRIHCTDISISMSGKNPTSEKNLTAARPFFPVQSCTFNISAKSANPRQLKHPGCQSMFQPADPGHRKTTVLLI